MSAPADVSEVEKLSTEIAQLPERGQAAARRGYHVAAGLTEAVLSKVLVQRFRIINMLGSICCPGRDLV